MSAKKSGLNISTLLGGSKANSTPTQQAEPNTQISNPQIPDSEKDAGFFRVTVKLTDAQIEKLRMLAWYERKRLKELYSEAFQEYMLTHNDKIENAAREYEAAGRPPLEMRGKR